MVSLSAHQPSQGAAGGTCVCVPACVEENGEEAVGVSVARGRNASLEMHMHAAGGLLCQNAPQKLSCIQFSLLHPPSSFILSPPFIYLYPFPQQPPLSCPLRVEENTPAVYLALHSACTSLKNAQKHLYKN